VLGHPRPFFAPVAAVVCLGLSYLDLVDELAELVGELADTLTERGRTADVRPALERLARAPSAAPHPEVMSAVVVLAQVRSMVVDLLELTSLDQDQALARVPRPG
jgi:uncharacterized membrane protein YgaE (UPF0421/DUF939 family)